MGRRISVSQLLRWWLPNRLKPCVGTSLLQPRLSLALQSNTPGLPSTTNVTDTSPPVSGPALLGRTCPFVPSSLKNP